MQPNQTIDGVSARNHRQNSGPHPREIIVSSRFIIVVGHIADDDSANSFSYRPDVGRLDFGA